MKSKNYIVISLTDGAVHAQKDISKLKNHTRKVVSTKKRKPGVSLTLGFYRYFRLKNF